MATFKSRIPQVTKQSRARVAAAVRKTADDIRDGAAARSPVASGALRDGWKVDGDGDERVVFNEQFYANIVEVGGVHTAPRPMLTPSVEDAREPFERAIREAYDG